MLDRATDILSDLIAFPTISPDSNLDMIAYIANQLDDAGAEVDTFADPSGTKANLFATFGPMQDGGIVLSGHSDVVPVTDQVWATDPFAMTEQDGRLYGRGTCDMKGFIAATLALAPQFGERATARPLHVAITYDEETGCIGARHLAASLKSKGIRPGIAIIGEPTEMRIIEGHKGCYEYTTRFEGLEGHGSDPDRGVNAVEYAVRFVSRLLELKDQLRDMAPDDSRFSPPWTTMNVGSVTGGHAHNVIASRAEVAWEMRPVQDADATYVKRALRRLCEDQLLPAMQAVHPGASITTEVMGEIDGLIPVEENAALDLLSQLTGSNVADTVAFGTEAGIFQGLDMDVVVCGPGSITEAHKANEFLEINQLDRCLTMLQRLCESENAGLSVR